MLIFRLEAQSEVYTSCSDQLQTHLIMNAVPLTQPAPAPRVHGSTVHTRGGCPTSAEQWLLLSHCYVDSPTPW